jgi:hypothetical protein
MSESELSFGEEQLWLAEQPGSTAFPFIDCTRTLSMVIRLESTLNHQALKASLDAIVRRHEVLRSRFVVEQGRPVRLLRRSSVAKLTVIDLCPEVADDRPARVTRVLDRHVARRFDLTRGPLLRAVLMKVTDAEHILAITVHHIVFDRWSKRVLSRELTQLYDAHAAGRTPDIAPLRARYRDYVQWQRDQLDSEFSRQLVAYWTATLKGLGDLALSDSSHHERRASTRGGKWLFTIPEEETSRLRQMSRRSKVTLATVLLTLFMLLLSRLSGQDDIAVGMPLSDRRHPDFEHLIGLFANLVIVRVTIPAGIAFRDLLERVRRVLFDACRYQDLPYGHLLQVVGAQRPLHRVVFNFLPEIGASAVSLDGLRVTPLPATAEHPAVADLSLHVVQRPGALSCGLLYKAELFSSTWAQAFAARFQALVTAALDEPQKSVSAYDCELRQLDQVPSV